MKKREDYTDMIVPNTIQQFDPTESNTNEDDYTDIEDS